MEWTLIIYQNPKRTRPKIGKRHGDSLWLLRCVVLSFAKDLVPGTGPEVCFPRTYKSSTCPAVGDGVLDVPRVTILGHRSTFGEFAAIIVRIRQKRARPVRVSARDVRRPSPTKRGKAGDSRIAPAGCTRKTSPRDCSRGLAGLCACSNRRSAYS